MILFIRFALFEKETENFNFHVRGATFNLLGYIMKTDVKKRKHKLLTCHVSCIKILSYDKTVFGFYVLILLLNV